MHQETITMDLETGENRLCMSIGSVHGCLYSVHYLIVTSVGRIALIVY